MTAYGELLGFDAQVLVTEAVSALKIGAFRQRIPQPFFDGVCNGTQKSALL